MAPLGDDDLHELALQLDQLSGRETGKATSGCGRVSGAIGRWVPLPLR